MSLEQVLVFPTTVLSAIMKEPYGLCCEATAIDTFRRLMASDLLFYLDREIAEKTPDYKQIIPYTLFRQGGKYFAYQRTKKGGESRLHDKWSLGVGGHINPRDGKGKVGYLNAFWRELDEEVEFCFKHGICSEMVKENIVGLLYDPSNEVGKVHFGVVHLIDLDPHVVMKTFDPALDCGRFEDAAGIISRKRDFENWSQLLIDNIVE